MIASTRAAPLPDDSTRLSNLSATTLTGIAQAEAIAAAWMHLEARQSRPVFFQSFAWCLYVWRTRAASDPNAPEPRIIVVRDGTTIAAIWPLAVRSGLAGRIAEDLTEPYGQYSDALVDPDAGQDAVRRAAMRELASWKIDALVLRKVRADSALASWLAAYGQPVGPVELAPIIDLAAAGGPVGWHKTLNAKTRKNLRNMRNRLAREGTITHRIAETPHERAETIANCFRGRADWLEAGGLSSTAFADPSFEAIVGGLGEGLQGAPKVTALRFGLSAPAGTSPASAPPTDLSLHWGFEHQGTYYAYMAWKNPAFDTFSPGRLHLETIVGDLGERGITMVDMLVPGIPYKLSMSTGAVTVQAYGLAFTARGKLTVQGWHGHLRPALKRALLAIKPETRRAIVDGLRTLASIATRGVAILRPRSRAPLEPVT